MVITKIQFFLLSNTRLVYQSFEASRKITRHQQSLTWQSFDTNIHLALDGDRTLNLPIVSDYSTARPQLSLKDSNFVNETLQASLSTHK